MPMADGAAATQENSETISIHWLSILDWVVDP
jgi:hypothetical protein